MTALKALCVALAESTPEQVRELQGRVARLELELAECWELAERRTRMWHQTLLAYREVKELLRSLVRNPERFERLKGKNVEFVIRPVMTEEARGHKGVSSSPKFGGVRYPLGLSVRLVISSKRSAFA